MTCGVETIKRLEPKSPTESKDFDCSFEVPNYRQSGKYYPSGARVQSEIFTGFEYEAEGDGWSAHYAPRFPKEAGARVQDGSVPWIARTITDASLAKKLNGDPVWSAEGLTVSGQQVYGQISKAIISGGVDGQDYLIKVSGVFDDGTTAEFYAILPVRIPKP